MAKAKSLKEEGSDELNGAKSLIEMGAPRKYKVRIRGESDYLYHRFNNEEYAAKSSAAKNSAKKKEVILENLVYRDENGFLGISSLQLKASLTIAAKFKQDPRSPRKSAHDLIKAIIICDPKAASVGKKTWDYEDKQRAVIQKSAILRVRPALSAGWEASFILTCLMPEYADASFIHEIINYAGMLCGVGDQRPSYGRFAVTLFEEIK